MATKLELQNENEDLKRQIAILEGRIDVPREELVEDLTWAYNTLLKVNLSTGEDLHKMTQCLLRILKVRSKI